MFSENNNLLYLTALNALVLAKDLIEILKQFVDGEMMAAVQIIAKAVMMGPPQ